MAFEFYSSAKCGAKLDIENMIWTFSDIFDHSRISEYRVNSSCCGNFTNFIWEYSTNCSFKRFISISWSDSIGNAKLTLRNSPLILVNMFRKKGADWSINYLETRKKRVHKMRLFLGLFSNERNLLLKIKKRKVSIWSW